MFCLGWYLKMILVCYSILATELPLTALQATGKIGTPLPMSQVLL